MAIAESLPETTKGQQFKAKRPLIFIWLFVAVFLPLMLSLGQWQLDRADQKQQRAEILTLQSQLPLRTYPSYDPIKLFEPRLIQGHFTGQHFLLDNRQYQGKVGYELASVFALDSGGSLLVNQGWIAAPKYRDKLPKVSSIVTPQSLTGYFYWTEKSLPVWNEDAEFGEKSIWRVQSLNMEKIRELSAADLVENSEFRLLHRVPFASDIGATIDAPDLYWNYQSQTPDKHTGYAFQWFAMSFALVILALWATYKLIPRT